MDGSSNISDLIKQATTPEESKCHLIYVFREDLNAKSSDPKDLADHFRIPLTYRIDKDEDKTSVPIPELGPKDEFVISKIFCQTDAGKQILKMIPGIETAPESFFRSKHLSDKPLRDTIKMTIVKRVLVQIQPLSKKIKKCKSDKSIKKMEKMMSKMDMGKGKDIDVSNSNNHLLKQRCNPAEIVASFENGWFVISFSSLNSLKPGEYLNDEIVDFGLYTSLKKNNPNNRIIYMGTYVWGAYFFRHPDDGCSFPKQQNKIYQLIKDRTEFDVINTKYLIVPVNREKHWMLALVCFPFPNKSTCEQILLGMQNGNMQVVTEAYNSWLDGEERPHVFLFDSLLLYLEYMKEFHTNTCYYLAAGLHGLHQAHWRLKTGNEYDKLFDPKKIPVCSVTTPQQKNKADCGVFCMAYLHYILEHRRKHNNMDFAGLDFRWWFHPDIEHLREKLYDAILDNCKKTKPHAYDHVDELRKQLFYGLAEIKEETNFAM